MTWLESMIKEYKYDPYYNWCKFCLWIGEEYYGRLYKYKIARYFKAHHGEHFTAADISEALDIDFWICDQVCEDLKRGGRIE